MAGSKVCRNIWKVYENLVIKAIIFDLFGVILTDGLQALVDELTLRAPHKGERIGELAYASSRGFITSEESNTEIAELLGLSYEAYRTKVRASETKDVALLDYIVELRKEYKTGLLSNVGSGGILRRFKVEELDKYFDAFVASAEVGFAKPEPEIYEIMADRLGVRLDECVFTDDREEYCLGAQGVGMQAIRYESFEQFKPELEKLLERAG